jgi:hypothetical protein
MFKKTASAALCLVGLWSVTPALAAPKEMPQGQRDAMAQKDTKREMTMQRKENKEANKNVDSLITNRK